MVSAYLYSRDEGKFELTLFLVLTRTTIVMTRYIKWMMSERAKTTVSAAVQSLIPNGPSFGKMNIIKTALMMVRATGRPRPLINRLETFWGESELDEASAAGLWTKSTRCMRKLMTRKVTIEFKTPVTALIYLMAWSRGLG